MKTGMKFALATAVVLAAPLASADTVVLEASGLISGTQSVVQPFQTAGAGSLVIKLQDLGWPDRLANLSFALATTTSVLNRLAEPGQGVFDVTRAGTYYALVSGTGQGRFDTGLYSLSIKFHAFNDPSPVPLPGTAWMLLLGVAGLAGALRGRGLPAI